MKTDIHPEYKSVTVHCSCGNSFETRSTGDDLRVELCSECHPFYTGKQKLVDTGGRIDRFERRYGRRNKGPAAALADQAEAEAAARAEAKKADAESAAAESADTES